MFFISSSWEMCGTASKSPFYSWLKCGSARLHHLSVDTYILAHRGLRFKPRPVWISNWSSVRDDFLSHSWYLGQRQWCEKECCASLPSHLTCFLSSAISSTTSVPLHLLRIKLGKQKWNEQCFVTPSLETPTYTGLTLLMMFYWFPL